MTDKEIDSLGHDDLEVAYAERVLGYSYHPGKTVRRPWRWGAVECSTLPDFLAWGRVIADVRLLTDLDQTYPFLKPHNVGWFSVQLTISHEKYQVEIQFLENDYQTNIWKAKDSLFGAAFLRVMLKASEWFRQKRGWEPN